MKLLPRVASLIGLALAQVMLLAPPTMSDTRGVKSQARERARPQRVALVIGNAAYQNDPLRNPVNDARVMAQVLDRLGFQVTKGENLTLSQMRRIIDQFGRDLRGAQVGLFYYAGHGIQVDGRNYLIPVDALLRDKGDVEKEAVKAGRLLDRMQGAENRLNLVVLDACRDNPFAGSLRGRSGQGLASMDAPSGTVIAYATAPGKVAVDGVGNNSPFTAALSRYLGQPGISVDRAFKSTGAEVRRATDGKQEPWISTNYYGEYFLAGGAPSAQGRQSANIAQKIKNSVGMEFVLIPAGKFMMGSHESPEVVARNGGGKARDYRCEKPRHRVTISEPFYMQTTEVTQRQWQAVMGKNPSQFKQCGADCPVDRVSWEDAQKFIRRLNQKVEANQYRLPTEAEWEYACRAGTITPFYFGETISTDQANYDGNYVYGQGRKGVYRERTVPVKSFPPNPWGLYGMHGNVWEWVSDWYGAKYYASSPSKDPQGPSNGQYRVLRGGSWGGKPKALRSAARRGTFPAGRGNCGGFRLVREAQ